MKMRKLLISGIAGASALLAASPALAQAGESYMGEVQLYANSYCPKGLADTQGQLLSISQNQALFSLLGTTYGGNGIQTFALPDLRGRSAISWGQGPGLSSYTQGQVGGTESVTLLVTQMPAHQHTGNLRGVSALPDVDDPTNAALADFPDGTPIYATATTPDVNMAVGTVQVQPVGSSQPFQNLGPYLTLRYCIVQFGIFPSRN